MARTALFIIAFFLLVTENTWAQQPATPPKPVPPPSKPTTPSAKPPGPPLSEAAKHTMELRAALDTLRVTLVTHKTTLSAAVRSLASSLSKVNIVLDESLPAHVKNREKTLSLRNVPLRAVLTQLTQPDLAFEVIYEAVYISTPAGIADLVAYAPIIPEDLSPEGKAVVDALRHKRLSFTFENTSLQDAVTVLSQLTGVKMTLDPNIPPDKKRTITLSMADVYLESALIYLTGKDLNYGVSLGAIFISTNEGVQQEMARRAKVKKQLAEKSQFGDVLSKPVTCEFTNTPLNDAVAMLGTLTKTRIVFEPTALQTVGSKALVNGKFKNVPLSDALERILPEKLEYTVRAEEPPTKPGTPPAKETEKIIVVEIGIKGAKKSIPPAKK